MGLRTTDQLSDGPGGRGTIDDDPLTPVEEVLVRLLVARIVSELEGEIAAEERSSRGLGRQHRRRRRFEANRVSVFSVDLVLKARMPADMLSPASKKLVLVCLAKHCCNDLGLVCYPSRATMAIAAERTVRTVDAFLVDLVARGFIAETDKAGHHRPRTFRINVARLVELQPVVSLPTTERVPDLQQVTSLPTTDRAPDLQQVTSLPTTDRAPDLQQVASLPTTDLGGAGVLDRQLSGSDLQLSRSDLQLRVQTCNMLLPNVMNVVNVNKSLALTRQWSSFQMTATTKRTTPS